MKTIPKKTKTQAYIRLDMKMLNEEKTTFLESVLREWNKAGDDKEKGYNNLYIKRP